MPGAMPVRYDAEEGYYMMVFIARCATDPRKRVSLLSEFGAMRVPSLHVDARLRVSMPLFRAAKKKERC